MAILETVKYVLLNTEVYIKITDIHKYSSLSSYNYLQDIMVWLVQSKGKNQIIRKLFKTVCLVPDMINIFQLLETCRLKFITNFFIP